MEEKARSYLENKSWEMKTQYCVSGVGESRRFQLDRDEQFSRVVILPGRRGTKARFPKIVYEYNAWEGRLGCPICRTDPSVVSGDEVHHRNHTMEFIIHELNKETSNSAALIGDPYFNL